MKQSSQNGEYYITDIINDFVAEGNTMKVVPAIGQYLDGGTLEGWLKANEVVGQDLAPQKTS
jgi:dTDP-glucose pyrophosphorylase